jgi:hypothetical protein
MRFKILLTLCLILVSGSCGNPNHKPEIMDKEDTGDTGDNIGDSNTALKKIQHIGTTQVWDSDGQRVTIAQPDNTAVGDLLVLVLHRTDDLLPYDVNDWTRRAECYKEDNGYQCLNIADCSAKSGKFCIRFQNKYSGRDLAQVVFTRTATSLKQTYLFNMNQDTSGNPGWAILTALRGADTNSPVRSWANRGCDNDADSLFPSVPGRNGDMLLLSQSFDDAVSKSTFTAPDGMTTFGYVGRSDESGFMFAGSLTQDGPTGIRHTNGPGASSCKDALVSMTIKPKP